MTMLWNNTSGQQKICKEKTLNKSKEKKCMFAMYVAYLQAAWDGNQAGCQDGGQVFPLRKTNK